MAQWFLSTEVTVAHIAENSILHKKLAYVKSLRIQTIQIFKL